MANLPTTKKNMLPQPIKNESTLSKYGSLPKPNSYSTNVQKSVNSLDKEKLKKLYNDIDSGKVTVITPKEDGLLKKFSKGVGLDHMMKNAVLPIASTAAYGLTGLGTGSLGFAEKGADALAIAIGHNAGGMQGLWDKEGAKKTKEFWGSVAKQNVIQPVRDAMDKTYGEGTKINKEDRKKYYNFMEGVGDTATSAYLGGALGNIAKGGKFIKGAARMLPFATGAFGGGTVEALNEGASFDKASLYGLGNAALETGVEMMSGRIGGLAGNKLEVLNKVPALNELSKSAKGKAIGKVLGEVGDVLGEGVEEVISEKLNPYLKRATYDSNAELATGEDLLKAGLGGMLTSGLLKGGQKLGDIQLPTAKVNTEINNNAISEAGQETINDKNQISENQKILQDIQNNNINEMNFMKNTNANFEKSDIDRISKSNQHLGDVLNTKTFKESSISDINEEQQIANIKNNVYNNIEGVGDVNGENRGTNQTGLYEGQNQNVEQALKGKYTEFEQQAKHNTITNFTKEEQQLKNYYKTKYNKNIEIFDDSNTDFGGGVSKKDNSTIFLGKNTIKGQGISFLAGHELGENIYRESKGAERIRLDALIQKIQDDSNFGDAFLDYLGEMDDNMRDYYIDKPQLIAKEILADTLGFMQNNNELGTNLPGKDIQDVWIDKLDSNLISEAKQTLRELHDQLYKNRSTEDETNSSKKEVMERRLEETGMRSLNLDDGKNEQQTTKNLDKDGELSQKGNTTIYADMGKNSTFSVESNDVEIENKIRKAIDYTISNKQLKGSINLGDVNKKTANIIKKLNGANVDKNKYELSTFSIRNMLNKHNPSKKNGQAITEQDIVKIPELLNNADTIIEGSAFVNKKTNKTFQSIRFTKQYGDCAYNVEVVQMFDNSLTVKRMWKKKVTMYQNLTNNKEIPSRKQVTERYLEETGMKNINLDSGKKISKLKANSLTPERVIEATFPKHIAKQINENVMNPVKHDVAEFTRFANRERDSIKELGIKPKSKESAAIQKYGEKQYIDKHGDIKKYTEADLKREFPNNWQNLKKASETIREKYDTYLDMVNEARSRNGYKPIPKVDNYFTHFEGLSNFIEKFGDITEINQLPTEINGLTEFFSPGITYSANDKHRTGKRTVYDAITGIDRYIESIGKQIYLTDSIQKLRAFEKKVRWDYSEKWINELTEGEMYDLDISDKGVQERLKKISEYHLSEFASWLHQYTNGLAGKNAGFDRGLEDELGRRVYKVLNLGKKQVGSNMTGLNVGSSLSNFISVVQAAPKTSKIALAKGAIGTVANIFNDDGFVDKSDFLTARFGSEALSKTLWQKASNSGQILMSATDYFTANLVTRSKYSEYRQKGFSEQESIKKADDFARRIMAGRAQGDMPNVFNSKILGLVTQFRLEELNQFSDIKDTFKKDYTEDTKSKFAKENPKMYNAAIKTWIFAQTLALPYLFNDLFEKIVGRRPMPDPIGTIERAFKHYNNSNLSSEEATKKVRDEILAQIPFADLLVGGGRIPLAGALPRFDKIKTGETTFKKEAWNAGSLLLPTGSNQIKKVAEGLSMFKKDPSGSYTDSGGLRYGVSNTLSKKIQAGLFGQYSVPEARDYFDNNYSPLKDKKITEYKDSGLNMEEYRKFLNDTKGMKTEEKLNYIKTMKNKGLNKDILYANVSTRKDTITSEYEKYNSLADYDYAKKHPEEHEYLKQNGLNTLSTSKGTEKSTKEVEKNSSDNKVKSANKKIVQDAMNNGTTSDVFKDFDKYSKETQNKIKSNPYKYGNIHDLGIEIGKYENYSNDIKKIKAGTNRDKEKTLEYIESLQMTVAEKVILAKYSGYAIKGYEKEVSKYIEGLKLTKERKQELYKEIY